jgi:hypothetical protein
MSPDFHLLSSSRSILPTFTLTVTLLLPFYGARKLKTLLRYSIHGDGHIVNALVDSLGVSFPKIKCAKTTHGLRGISQTEKKRSQG